MNMAMAEKEEALYSKFTAMEAALAKMNSQASAIMAQMGFAAPQ
jgi:flagellar capping protein FliD